ncbi:MAG: hypothetical protein HY069_05225, partial [Chlamydiia bacterium]|nr:hypothetical protein [Chlamydiia bacterium]
MTIPEGSGSPSAYYNIERKGMECDVTVHNVSEETQTAIFQQLAILHVSVAPQSPRFIQEKDCMIIHVLAPQDEEQVCRVLEGRKIEFTPPSATRSSSGLSSSDPREPPYLATAWNGLMGSIVSPDLCNLSKWTDACHALQTDLQELARTRSLSKEEKKYLKQCNEFLNNASNDKPIPDLQQRIVFLSDCAKGLLSRSDKSWQNTLLAYPSTYSTTQWMEAIKTNYTKSFFGPSLEKILQPFKEVSLQQKSKELQHQLNTFAPQELAKNFTHEFQRTESQNDTPKQVIQDQERVKPWEITYIDCNKQTVLYKPAGSMAEEGAMQTVCGRGTVHKLAMLACTQVSANPGAYILTKLRMDYVENNTVEDTAQTMPFKKPDVYTHIFVEELPSREGVSQLHLKYESGWGLQSLKTQQPLATGST